MQYKRASAMLAVVLMAFVPFGMIVSAAEEPATPVPFTTPGEVTPGVTDPNMEYAVYFADNMAFTPQWRLGNLVRVETMVLKAFEFNDDGILNASDIPVAVNTNITSGVVYDQASLLGNPDNILWTWMVSVPSITVTITGEKGDVHTFASDFTDGVSDADLVTRETNKAGHLIYGFLWDTESASVLGGVYRVSVDAGSAYPVTMAVRSLVVAEDADPIGYEELPAGTLDAFVSGTGGVSGDDAYIYLGTLIAKGGSSGGGGGNGGSGGSGGHKGGR
jgi:hypothetical protein